MLTEADCAVCMLAGAQAWSAGQPAWSSGQPIGLFVKEGLPESLVGNDAEEALGRGTAQVPTVRPPVLALFSGEHGTPALCPLCVRFCISAKQQAHKLLLPAEGTQTVLLLAL